MSTSSRGRVRGRWIAAWTVVCVALLAVGEIRADDGGVEGPADVDDAVVAAEAPAAAETEEEAAPEGPTRVYVGLYPLRIGDLDLHTGTAQVTYYQWQRWDGPVDGASVEVVNGEVTASESEYVQDEDGAHYVYHRFTTRAQLQPDFHAFPFDEHEVSIELEHASEGSTTIDLVVDEEGVRHVESPRVAGWIVDRPTFDVVPSRYATSFGMPGVSADEVSEYPRVRMRVRLHHDAMTTFWKTFLTLFISVLIALLGTFMHHDELEARVGVGVAGIFGAVTSQSVVAANLPDIPYMTLSDKVHLAGIVFVFLALLETCAVGWLARHERPATAAQLDRVARWVMAPSFAACVIALLMLR